MKDDTSTPTGDGDSPNSFESAMPGTADRSRAEAAIEELRARGGVFVEAVRATRMPMALTDPNLPGNPIVFANEAFRKLTGYSMDEVLGQRPHFMNGAGTDPKDASRFAEAIRADQDDIIETVQYRKNGSRFVASVLISAFKDSQGRTLNHFMSWLDVTRRAEAEDEVANLQGVQSALGEELRNTQLLHDLGTRLVSEDSVQTIYEELLSAAIEITGADAGTVQALDLEAQELLIIATRGFSQKTTDYFHRVDARSNTSCGIALRSGERAYLNFDPASTDTSARMHVDDGVLSAQSTPLISRSGQPIGMVSTHWSGLNHRPTERQLHFLDLLARQTADLIERTNAEAALRDSERHAQTLLAELQHRVRNTLAIVRSIARRTADNSSSVEDMLGHFQGRLNAFSRVQAALTRNANATIDLASLIEDELAAHGARDGEQIAMNGPEVRLEARTAEQLSLAIHELTTNAVKHGALIGDRGTLSINWRKERLNGSEDLVLSWTEGGLQLDGERPSRSGFGMELLQRSLPYDLGAETEFQFRPEGLHFELRMPLRNAADVN